MPACELFYEAQTVFVGTVIEHNDDGYRGDLPSAYLVRVDEAFRGMREGETELFLDPGSFTSCQRQYKVGEQYLFFGFGGGFAQGILTSGFPARWAEKKGHRFVGAAQCNPTRPVKMAGEDLAWLRKRRGDEQTRVFGVALQAAPLGFGPRLNDGDVPLGGASVVLTKANGERRTTTAAADGSYSFDGVAPGDYRVFAQKDGWTGSRTEDVRLLAGGCAQNTLTLQSHAEAQGLVRDAVGRPAAGVRVEMVRVLPDGKLAHNGTHWAETDKDGRFRFRNLPAGTFVMGVNVRYAPTQQAPYTATYYPGVAKVEQAERLTFGPKTFLENLVVPLPLPIAKRAVRVNVLWADGRPVKDGARAGASQQGTGAAFESARSGSVVKLPLLEGLEYEIKGSWVGFVGEKMLFAESEPVRLPPGQDPVTIDVRLGPPRP